MAIDPVCKMKVDEKKAPATSEYQGKKYYFCARGLQEGFRRQPGEISTRSKTGFVIRF